MSNGYSTRFALAVNSADTSKIGVQLGNVCIDLDIPAVEVAQHVGVTRATIYNWFKGTTNVPPAYRDAVQDLVRRLTAR